MTGVLMTTQGEARILAIWQHMRAREALDEWVARRWPHDVYMQTVAVMGFDPLGEMGRADEEKPETELADRS
jgi:hypothetical protein